MEDYRRTLKKAGTILVIVGIVDIAVMIACVVFKRGYSSSLNIFAVGAGVFLIRGNLQATLKITRFGAFLLSGLCVAAVLVLPSVRPLSYWAVDFRLNTAAELLGLAYTLIVFPVLIWTYSLLRRPEVLAAMTSQGIATRPPYFWYGMGTTLAIVLAVLLHVTFNGHAATKAIDIARSRYGAQYEYAIDRITMSDESGSATLTAYKADEMKQVRVEW